MKSLESVWEEIAGYNENASKERFDEICEQNGFVKGEWTGVSGSGQVNYMMDHLFMFEDSNKGRCYVSNTYLKEDSIKEILESAGVSDKAVILGVGFWHENSLAVKFDYDMMEKYKRTGMLW